MLSAIPGLMVTIAGLALAFESFAKGALIPASAAHHVAPAPAIVLAQATTSTLVTLGRSEIAEGVAVEIVRLARVPGGNAVELRMDLVNTSSHPISLNGLGLLETVVRPQVPTIYVLRGVRIFDAQNGVIYDIGRGADRPLSTSRVSSNSPDSIVPPGARKSLWAMYGAPPPNVTQLTVLIDSAPPVTGVPLSQ